MKSRKEQILDLFETVPVLSRDQLIQEFFRDNANNKRLCAKYMRELSQDKKVKMEKRVTPFVCFHRSWRGSTITGKMSHHLAVADIYLKLKPQTFIWEPDLEYVTPDAFILVLTRWLNEERYTPMFVEYQAPGSHWSRQEMQKKIARYEKAYRRKKWTEYSQTPPVLWICTEKQYDIDSQHIKIVQRPL